MYRGICHFLILIFIIIYRFVKKQYPISAESFDFIGILQKGSGSEWLSLIGNIVSLSSYGLL